MEGGKKRRTRQLVRTVEKKISLLEDQKNDILENIDAYIQEVCVLM